MALPFLPEIEIMFHRLERQATTTKLQSFVRYVSETWINGSTWPPSSWSVFNQAVCTNNDIEGRHNMLNYRAFGKCQLSCKVGIRKKDEEIWRKKYCSMQAQVFMLWKGYENGERSAKQLLRTFLTAQFVVDVQMND